MLGRQFSGTSAFSDTFGNPVISRPTINANTGTEGTYADSLPGLMTGGVTVDSSRNLAGWK